MLFIFAAAQLFAQDAEAIMRKAEEKYAFNTSKAEISMLVYPQADNERNFREYSILSYGRGEEETYLEFLSPRSIKGLRILSKGGDQWVYFSSTGRVRKIAGKAKKESVRGVGGDFSYEDLGGEDMRKKYDFRVLQDRSDKWVLEGNPKTEDATYSRLVVTVDKSSYLIEKIEYYTEEEGHYKDMYMGEVKILGGREMPSQVVMINREKNSKTVIITHSALYDISVDEKYFNPNRFYK